MMCCSVTRLFGSGLIKYDIYAAVLSSFTHNALGKTILKATLDYIYDVQSLAWTVLAAQHAFIDQLFDKTCS